MPYAPYYGASANNNPLAMQMQYGMLGPMAFSPQSMYTMNPFMNPYFAIGLPYGLSGHPFGQQLINYMSFMNPMMYGNTGLPNTWQMGTHGMGTAYLSPYSTGAPQASPYQYVPGYGRRLSKQIEGKNEVPTTGQLV